jgi:hypothetical protein
MDDADPRIFGDRRRDAQQAPGYGQGLRLTMRGVEAGRFRPQGYLARRYLRYLVVVVVLAAATLIAVRCVSASETGAHARMAGRGAQPAASAAPPERIRFPASESASQNPRTIRSLLNIRQPMMFGDYVWNDAGVPPGPLWIRVDLKRQLLSLFRGGNEIATTVIIYGAQNKPTPPGRFRVLGKDKDYRSASYNTPMPYSLFLTRSGIAIHAAEVQYRNATHGCVGVPAEFARRLFDTVRVGVPVDITAAS